MILNKKKLITHEHFDSLLDYDRVSDFMSAPPITLTKDAAMSDAKELMRDHKISGIPIVGEEDHLIGLISLENIILALEDGRMDDPIGNHMVNEVVSLKADMKIFMAIEYLMTYSYGRYPVIDMNDKVVGVVTNGDLILHILERLGNVYLHDKKRDEILSPSKYLLTPGKYTSEECTSHGIFTYTIDTTDLDCAGKGSQLFKKHLQERELPADIIRRASIALYEAEVNVVLHAYGKGEIMACIEKNQLFVRITDEGPGIENIELAMQPGYTTASDEIRARGFGAGMGLANIKKYTDKVVILSNENGVKLEMVFVVKE